MWRKACSCILLEQGGGILLWFLLPFLGFSAIGTKLICEIATPVLCRWHWERRRYWGSDPAAVSREEKDVTESEGEKSSENDGRNGAKNVEILRNSYPGGDNSHSCQSRACRNIHEKRVLPRHP